MQKVLILGAGGHAQVVADILMRAHEARASCKPVGFLDDNSSLAGTVIMGLPREILYFTGPACAGHHRPTRRVRPRGSCPHRAGRSPGRRCYHWGGHPGRHRFHRDPAAHCGGVVGDWRWLGGHQGHSGPCHGGRGASAGDPKGAGKRESRGTEGRGRRVVGVKASAVDFGGMVRYNWARKRQQANERQHRRWRR